jgi:hypothetical protein
MVRLDPSVFYRDFSAASPVTTASQHLSAAATRLALSVVYAIAELPAAIFDQFRQLLTPETLWGLCLVVAAWLLATVIGGPIGVAINGLLAAYGLYELWPVVKEVGRDLWAWLRGAYYADNEGALIEAGQHFAAALAKGGLTTLEAIVTHRAFRGAAQKIRERYPTPEWLRKTYEEQQRKRSESESPKDDAARRTDAESKRRADESKRRNRVEDTVSGAAAAVLVPAGRGAGGAIEGLVVGGVAVVAVLAVVAGSAAMRKKGRAD